MSTNWNGFGIDESIWTVAILLVGAVIGIVRMLKDKNSSYGLVLVWAYGGILIKHTSASGFDGVYPTIITTVIVCMVLFVGSIGYVGYTKKAFSR